MHEGIALAKGCFYKGVSIGIRSGWLSSILYIYILIPKG